MIRYATYALMGLLIAGAVLITKPAFAQEWYPGDGVQEGLLVKYRISNFDYQKGQPFTATLWFGSQDDKGNWITDVIVEDRGKVSSGQLILSSLTLTPLGETSDELRPYRAPIKDSLAWLDSYASKINPKSLTGGVWGVIAAIGGGSITVQPLGQDTIEVAGKSWDVYVVGFRYGAESQLFIVDNFPLPIKAKVFALTTQHPIPVQFEFELLETRITDTPPVPPETQIELPTPPLSKTTTTAKFNVDLYWDPVEIQPGEPTKFGVVIFDAQGNLVRNIMYRLKIVDSEGNIAVDDRFTAQEGQRTHELALEAAGPLSVQVIVLGSPEAIAGDATSVEFREEANFDLVVVPEFPISLAVVMASIVAIMVAMTRFRKISIPKL